MVSLTWCCEKPSRNIDCVIYTPANTRGPPRIGTGLAIIRHTRQLEAHLLHNSMSHTYRPHAALPAYIPVTRPNPCKTSLSGPTHCLSKSATHISQIRSLQVPRSRSNTIPLPAFSLPVLPHIPSRLPPYPPQPRPPPTARLLKHSLHSARPPPLPNAPVPAVPIRRRRLGTLRAISGDDNHPLRLCPRRLDRVVQTHISHGVVVVAVVVRVGVEDRRRLLDDVCVCVCVVPALRLSVAAAHQGGRGCRGGCEEDEEEDEEGGGGGSPWRRHVCVCLVVWWYTARG